MEEQQPFNPYAATDPYAVTAPVSSYPTGLRVYAIIALILGILGALTGLSAVGMNALGAATNNFGTGGQEEFTQDVQSQMNAVTNKYRAVNIVVGVVQLACCAGLIVGSVLLLQAKLTGVKVFLWSSLATILFEIGRGVFTTIVLISTYRLMADFQTQMMQGPNGQAMPEDMMKTVFLVSFIVGASIGYIWIILKLVFYTLAIRYVSKPETKAFLAGQTAA